MKDREKDRSPGRGEETVAAGSTERRLATVVVRPLPLAGVVVVVAVVVVRRDTVVERRHEGHDRERRKRVVMGRESRGVLLLVALAVLAAADAFSTDSKSPALFIFPVLASNARRERRVFRAESERQRAKGKREGQGDGEGAGRELVLKAWLSVYTKPR